MKCLVILLNQCRLDYLGCYGNDWLATPALDRLAAESVVFDQHFADSPTVAGARRAWRTGRFAGSPPVNHDLPRALWQHGVFTAMLGDELSPSRGSRFARSWEWRHWIRRHRLQELEQESPMGGVVQTAIEWLQQNGSRQNWLLWVELGALQPPWDGAEFDAEALIAQPPEGFEPWLDAPLGTGHEATALDRLRNTYGGIVGGLDQWLGQLLDFLRSSDLHKDLWVIVTSDVGLPLGDRGVVGVEPPRLHEESVHLPLIVHQPGGAEAGRRVQHLTLTVDLWPTLAETFGLPTVSTVHGRSLLPLARGESKRIRDFACCHVRNRGQEEWSLRTQQWCLLLPACSSDSEALRPPQLYVKPDDRWEVNNVYSQHPELADHLELALHRFAAAIRADRFDEVPTLSLPSAKR